MIARAGHADVDEAEDEEDEDSNSEDIMTLMSDRIQELSPGDRAGLRRIFLTERHDADGVVIGLLHQMGRDIPTRAEAFASWRLLAHVAALLSGTGGDPSHSSRRFGTALQGAGYSKPALLRLISARGPMLQGQIIRAARRLARKGDGPVNLWTVLDLAGRDATKVEEARLRIAHDFYTAEARSERTPK